MAGCGALNPFPFTFGGGRTKVRAMLDSLNRQTGTAIDTSEMAPRYIENLVTARILAGMHATAGKLQNEFDLGRTNVFLPRWERIFAQRVRAGDSPSSRRARLAAIEARQGAPIRFETVESAAREALGSFFVAIETVSSAMANIHVPDASYPWGTVADGAPWYSTVSHLLVRMQKPADATEAQFYDAAARLVEALDPILPSHVTFDWYRPPALANGQPQPAAVVGGPSAGGFFLDDPHNLDNDVFDV